jgi:hypothetical protein
MRWSSYQRKLNKFIKNTCPEIDHLLSSDRYPVVTVPVPYAILSVILAKLPSKTVISFAELG